MRAFYSCKAPRDVISYYRIMTMTNSGTSRGQGLGLHWTLPSQSRPGRVLHNSDPNYTRDKRTSTPLQPPISPPTNKHHLTLNSERAPRPANQNRTTQLRPSLGKSAKKTRYNSRKYCIQLRSCDVLDRRHPQASRSNNPPTIPHHNPPTPLFCCPGYVVLYPDAVKSGGGGGV